VQDVLEIFRRKTAPAFEVAMRIGAIAAGADEAGEALSACSRELGIAYQIRDDLEDAGGDRDLSPSLLAALGRETASGGAEDRAEASGAEDRARAMLEAGRARAIAALRRLSSTPLRQLLRRVVARIFNETDALSCCHDDHAGNASGGRPGPPDAGA
jgi:geranylgeranyl pyrophosphate synthase